VYAVGAGGTIVKWGGASWATVTSGTSADLHAVWGDGKGNVYAGGADQTLLQQSGKVFKPVTWTPAVTGTIAAKRSVRALANGFALGDFGMTLQGAGSAWKEMSRAATLDHLYAIRGSGKGTVHAVGEPGVVRFDGKGWKATAVGSNYKLRDVWESATGEVFAVGLGGLAMHFDGSKWHKMTTGTSNILRSVWGSSSSDVHAVGGVNFHPGYLHYDGNKAQTLAKLKGPPGSFPPTHLSSTGTGYLYAARTHNVSLAQHNGIAWADAKLCAKAHEIWAAPGGGIFYIEVSHRLHYFNGKTCSLLLKDQGGKPLFLGIGGVPKGDAYVVGPAGATFSCTPTNCKAQRSGASATLHDVWGTPAGAVYVVGEGGTILRRTP